MLSLRLILGTLKIRKAIIIKTVSLTLHNIEPFRLKKDVKRLADVFKLVAKGKVAKRKPAKKKVAVRYRSAKTGYYVTEKYAKKHPMTTVRETAKVKRGKKK